MFDFFVCGQMSLVSTAVTSRRQHYIVDWWFSPLQYTTIFFYCSRRQTAAKVTYTTTCRPTIV